MRTWDFFTVLLWKPTFNPQLMSGWVKCVCVHVRSQNHTAKLSFPHLNNLCCPPSSHSRECVHMRNTHTHLFWCDLFFPNSFKFGRNTYSWQQPRKPTISNVRNKTFCVLCSLWHLWHWEIAAEWDLLLSLRYRGASLGLTVIRCPNFRTLLSV